MKQRLEAGLESFDSRSMPSIEEQRILGENWENVRGKGLLDQA